MAALGLLLPMLLLYEVGTLVSDPTADAAGRVMAFHLLDWFFGFFGVASLHLPTMAAVVILLTWHVLCRDPWTIHLPTTAAMTVESIALAAPLLLLSRILGPVVISAAAQTDWVDEVILSVGAGIYEELLFRLILISLLGLILVDIAGLDFAWGYGIAVVVSALLFAGHHYKPLAAESFSWISFAFRTIAGLYLAGIFVFRGFGLAVGCHAAYDLMVVLLGTRIEGAPS